MLHHDAPLTAEEGHYSQTVSQKKLQHDIHDQQINEGTPKAGIALQLRNDKI